MTREEKQNLLLNIYLFYGLTYFCATQGFVCPIKAGKDCIYQNLS